MPMDSFLPPKNDPGRVEYEYGESSRFVAQVRSNVKSDLIMIMDSNLRVILMKHLDRLHIKRAWINPLTLLITALLAVTTANFTMKFGVEGPMWQACFTLAAIFSALWLICALVRLWYYWKECSIDYLMDLIKSPNKETDHEDTDPKANYFTGRHYLP